MSKEPHKATLVYILWMDAAYTHDGDPATFAPVKLHIVGWLVRETDEYVVLGMERDQDGGYRDMRAIPHFNVIERREEEYTMAAEEDEPC
jgi:hypothetical protein